ncbi:helix-turn-helix domain-containing protein [Paenibacillus sp. SYP-B4298]|uniref:helix-turn-helix domain-containing protein n=1 Tax=Paenibacillus sp. SYP-B4298 TaxID=2996034 RepID=UPI0022DD0166|nr:helix-turn-helix transcriptional regulator [Paenibacillus sp. SYP-B4298]
MKTTYKTDSRELKKIMIDRGISTIVQLSAVTGVNRNTLSNILNGESQPSAEVMRKLVAALEIPPEQAGRIFFNPNLRIA